MTYSRLITLTNELRFPTFTRSVWRCQLVNNMQCALSSNVKQTDFNDRSINATFKTIINFMCGVSVSRGPGSFLMMSRYDDTWSSNDQVSSCSEMWVRIISWFSSASASCCKSFTFHNCHYASLWRGSYAAFGTRECFWIKSKTFYENRKNHLTFNWFDYTVRCSVTALAEFWRFHQSVHWKCDFDRYRGFTEQKQYFQSKGRLWSPAAFCKRDFHLTLHVAELFNVYNCINIISTAFQIIVATVWL